MIAEYPKRVGRTLKAHGKRQALISSRIV